MEYLTLEQRKNKLIKQILFWTIFVLVLGGGVWGIGKLAASSKNSQVSGTTIPAVTATDHIRGDQNATVTIVEYSDFQCPACAATEPTLEQILKDYDGKVRLVYRNFPLLTIHKHAAMAVAAAEAAARQGKYWEMHDMLFDKQSEWAENPAAADIITGYAQSLGLDLNKFKSDWTSDSISNQVNADYASAINLKLNHTPTVFINGTELVNTSYAGFKQLIVEKM